MTLRRNAIVAELKAHLPVDRFRRYALPFALLLVIAVLSFVNWQQAQTIAAQQEIIHTLFQDSLELSAKHMQQQVKAPTADFKKPDVAPEPKKPAQQ